MFEQLFWELPGFQIFSLLSPEIPVETLDLHLTFFLNIERRRAGRRNGVWERKTDRPVGCCDPDFRALCGSQAFVQAR